MAELGEFVVIFACVSAVYITEFALLHTACRLVSRLWSRWAKKGTA